jgi:hypothetical protein
MHVAMFHYETGHVAQIAVNAVPHARKRGWELVEPDRPAPEPEPPAQVPDTSG